MLRSMIILALLITSCYLIVLGAFEIHHGAGVFIIGVLVSIAASVFLDATD